MEIEPRYRKNLNVLVPCFVVLGIMFGLVAYAPELYCAFCGATGYGGTTQRAYSDPTTASDQTVTVAFDSNVAPDLPWRFEPEQRSVVRILRKGRKDRSDRETVAGFVRTNKIGNLPIYRDPTIFPEQAVEYWQFGPAGGAPRRPEIQEYRLSA